MIDEPNDTNFVIPPPLPRSIPVYRNLDVQMSYQNFGSVWLCILRGSTPNIDLAFNGLFNFCATNGECTFVDHSKTVATFWSSEKQLERFFYLMRVYSGHSRYHGKKINKDFARQKIADLKSSCHEVFLQFDGDYAQDVFDNNYSFGSIVAERPDGNREEMTTYEPAQTITAQD